ncbi:uncharacterized protein BYT42DRAFT_543330 [Radiomyces spectabilis]|uniref:uncharacterized protein n=1 Tax=Radiomyces spectabilis TaxID=64574 RepID=UPI00221FD225|nr:uncharacterized protein BYT42DRAFT_543330 [Radiomyces spectabilis]KAI8391845.1 hypothetical protein BYT42DRAFT_543330 [Radiomyces spectabilis]
MNSDGIQRFGGGSVFGGDTLDSPWVWVIEAALLANEQYALNRLEEQSSDEDLAMTQPNAHINDKGLVFKATLQKITERYFRDVRVKMLQYSCRQQQCAFMTAMI